MANKMYKDRLVIVGAAPDKQTGKWTARITIAHTMYPAGSFDTEEKAEAFALKFATEYIAAEPSSSGVDLLSRRFDKLH